MSMNIQTALGRIAEKQDLTTEEMVDVMRQIMSTALIAHAVPSGGSSTARCSAHPPTASPGSHSPGGAPNAFWAPVSSTSVTSGSSLSEAHPFSTLSKMVQKSEQQFESQTKQSRRSRPHG